MTLRGWQSECISQAMAKYSEGSNHFLCLATPGAGKTRMAATLAHNLLQAGMVDLVLCFSPSIIVSSDFQEALETHTHYRMDGLLGSKGRSLTYQSMLHLDDSFWALFRTHRVFVIFDEIHHCAGHCMENANAWGQKIIQHVQGHAAYTIALTGTPWRSDRIPIALSSYCQNQHIFCDFKYGLTQAVKDNVCRTPRITLIDNDRVLVKRGSDTEKYSSFAELLKLSNCSYQQLIDNEDLIVYLLKQSSKKLRQVRKHHGNAGGLIVAASVEHAHKIASILQRHLGESACVATYMEDNAQHTINAFKESGESWIISVGMISEGTNIPRLRVCCHLTRVKTELHFRQVLGRILRADLNNNGESFLYMPAEPSLIEFANRVAEEIPEANTINFDAMPDKGDENALAIQLNESPATRDDTQIILEQYPPKDSDKPKNIEQVWGGSSLAESYDATINIFGRFKHELLSLNAHSAL